MNIVTVYCNKGMIRFFIWKEGSKGKREVGRKGRKGRKEGREEGREGERKYDIDLKEKIRMEKGKDGRK